VTTFNVVGLLREAPGATRQVRLRDHYLTLAPEVELAGPINGRLRLQRTNRGILLSGDVRGDVRRTCARCLDPYVEEARVTLSEEYLSSIDPETGMAVEPGTADENALRIDEHHEIDVAPLLREEFALTEPMHPLCRDDCPGLCAECGARLDSHHASHEAGELDPRLAGLAALLDPDRPEQ
jgi:uncharacterized protein